MQELVASNGERHGLINTVGNSVPDSGFKHMNPTMKAKAEKLKKEESKVVKAKYLNYRGTHERLSKPYCRWEGDPIQMWHFIPNETYEVPMGLVNEVNSSPGLARRSEILDAHGRPTMKEGKAEKLHEFVAIGF